MPMHRFLSCAFLAVAMAGPAQAQTREVPYWASITPEIVNMRVGPATSYPIAWVYKRPGLPMKVVRVSEGWRLVEDPDGERGWVLSRFLSRDRTAIVRGEGVAEMRTAERGLGKLAWRLEPGVTGKLGECDGGWCEFDVDGRKAYAPQDRLWGAGAP